MPALSKDQFFREAVQTAVDAVSGIKKVAAASAKEITASDFGAFWYYVHVPRHGIAPMEAEAHGGLNTCEAEMDVYIGGRAGEDPAREGKVRDLASEKVQQVYAALLTVAMATMEIGTITIRMDEFLVREPVMAVDDMDPIWRAVIQCRMKYTEIY